MHNYTIGPTNWDYKEVSVINSLRGDAVTIIVYRRTDGQTDGRTDGQTDNGVSHKLDWSRPVELTREYFDLNTFRYKILTDACMSSYYYRHLAEHSLTTEGVLKFLQKLVNRNKTV